jgi:dihydrofolate reductase
MPIKFFVYIATSLDGYIARENGDLDWLPQAGDEDYGYQTFFDSIDTLVIGRSTFEKVLTFDPWPFAGKRVVVLSNTLTNVPDNVKHLVEISNLQLRELAAHLEATGSKRVYVDGGKTIQSFLRAGLIDQLTLFTVPVLIGRGLPLFGELNSDVQLELVSSRAFRSGMTERIYRPIIDALHTPAIVK